MTAGASLKRHLIGALVGCVIGATTMYAMIVRKERTEQWRKFDEALLIQASKTSGPAATQLVEKLLESGVDVNAEDKHGLTALNWALDVGRLDQKNRDLVKLLDKYDAKLGHDRRNDYSAEE